MVVTEQADFHRHPRCVGCGSLITDQFILRVEPDLDWHAACLRCCTCSLHLSERATCFLRDGKPYCKNDYIRVFGAKCGKCSLSFQRSDLVMRARNNTYHVACFTCDICDRKLSPGDEIALRDNKLLCLMDCEVKVKDELKREDDRSETPGSAIEHSEGASEVNSSAESDEPPTVASPHGKGSCKEKRKNGTPRKEKSSRGRTVLNEKQLHTLSTCFSANPRPDALMKEQLVEMTGLSPRVIRVWFQNKRCKENKRQTALKNLQQKAEEGVTVLHGGTPLVATSPVRHEPSAANQPQPVEIYNWNMEYADDYLHHMQQQQCERNPFAAHHLHQDLTGVSS